MKEITKEILKSYQNHLIEEEKSSATVQKYVHDIERFSVWIGQRRLEKAEIIAYKTELAEIYSPASVNAAIASLNSFFSYIGRYDLKVKSLKIQKQTFAPEDKELNKAEYEKLLCAARTSENERLYLVMQTICSTGIRVSELKYITAEAVNRGVAEISCKGKRRQILLPKQLCRVLKKYILAKKIKKGAVFVTKSGAPLDRSNIWTSMKRLCAAAGVSEQKVFPHNLRHLFARTYYKLQKDIVRLADLLGHSNVNTTRIYTMESGEIHREQIQKLGLLRCSFL